MQEPRNLNLQTLRLKKGGHLADSSEMCVMEAVAFLAGERHSDTPECASPTVAAFLRNWNDNLDDEGRQELKQYIPRLVGSRGSAEIELQRSWLASDWLNRVQAPAWLDLAGLKDDAAKLRALPAFTDGKVAAANLPTLRTAQKNAAAAWDAAGDAAWDAGDAAWAAAWDAGDAAWAAAWAAAWDAARAATWAAARDAAWAAAWAAARDAARAAAWDAARAAAGARLAPTALALQRNAHALVDAMLRLTGA